MIQFVTVCGKDEIPDGEGRSFEVQDRVVAIFNRNGQFSAIDDSCPHMGASLAEGDFDVESCSVTCPWHGWRFSVTDGSWADNPKIKTDSFQVRVVGDEIQVAIPQPKLSESPEQPTEPPDDSAPPPNL